METPRPRSSRSRYLTSALLVAGAVAALLSWALLSAAATEAIADGLPRTDLPGELNVEVHPGTWHVYLEGGGKVTAVEVTDAVGEAVDVDLTDSAGYQRGGSTSLIVGTFTVPRAGVTTVDVVVDGVRDAGSESKFVVGAADAFDALVVPWWCTIGAIGADVAIALGIVVATPLRRRREARAARSAGTGPGAPSPPEGRDEVPEESARPS